MSYELKTTFLIDFDIANRFGVDAVRDTYERAFKEWHNEIVYVTELSLVLNWNIFKWYDLDEDLARTYDELWRECDEWCMTHLKGKDLDYYIKTTD